MYISPTTRFSASRITLYVSRITQLPGMLARVGQCGTDDTAVGIVEQVDLIELLQEALGLTAAEVPAAPLDLHNLAAAGKPKPLGGTLMSLHLWHELFLSFNLDWSRTRRCRRHICSWSRTRRCRRRIRSWSRT